MSGLLGSDVGPIEAGSPRPGNAQPTEAEAREFISILENAALECLCKLPLLKGGGAGWDCAACGRHTHIRLAFQSDPERTYCRPACRDTAYQAA